MKEIKFRVHTLHQQMQLVMSCLEMGQHSGSTGRLFSPVGKVLKYGARLISFWADNSSGALGRPS
jgi:hypothetical protein